MLRRLVGLLLLLGGLYLAYQSGLATFQYASRSGDLVATLLDPAFLMRNLGSIFAVVGGLSVVSARAGGVWWALFATLPFGVLTFAIFSAGADRSLWLDEAITTALLAVATLIIGGTKRTS